MTRTPSPGSGAGQKASQPPSGGDGGSAGGKHFRSSHLTTIYGAGMYVIEFEE